MAATLRGTFVEGEPAGVEETTGFNLEGVTIVEADPEETFGSNLEGTTINLDMPSAVAGENWVGKEVVVEGHFEEAAAEGKPPAGYSRWSRSTKHRATEGAQKSSERPWGRKVAYSRLAKGADNEPH